MPVKRKRRKQRLVSHHAHTAKLLPGKHTSYPLLAVLLLMVGILLLTTTLSVRADTVTVSATLVGKPPRNAATILSPISDTRFIASPVPVSGTCEYGYYVKLFRNDIFSGSALCTTAGTFQIETDLFEGRNDLQARIFSIADMEGPRSNVITVYYDVARADPFYLATDYFYKAAFTGQSINWDFTVHGGAAPYSVTIIWGDGYSDTLTGISTQKFSFRHKYNSLKTRRDYFVIKVQIVDKSGRKTSVQLIAIMNDESVIGGAYTKSDPPTGGTYGDWLLSLLRYVWSAYGLVVLMGLCFWLGERRGITIADAFNRNRRRAI